MVVGAGEVRAADADEALRFDPFALRTVSATTAGRIQRLAATASASRTARVIARRLGGSSAAVSTASVGTEGLGGLLPRVPRRPSFRSPQRP